MKNLVVCLDGTGNEFGDKNSNVVKLCQCLRRGSDQVVYYNPGIGTNPVMYQATVFGRVLHALSKLWDQATGKGIIKNASAAYTFLLNSYNPGDQIYIFGFSRGAYTARILCSMLFKFGLIDKGNENLVQYATSLLLNKNKKNDLLARGFSETFGSDCKPHFLGLWDTVSSVRWFVDPPSVPHTRTNPDIKIVRHAVSIDERRAYFKPNLFGAGIVGQDIKEVWFPGVHADVGGGYLEAESSLSKISLDWMLREAEAAGILIDEPDKHRVMGDGSDFASPSAAGLIHNEMFSGSNLFGFAELLPQLVWSYRAKARRLRIPLASWRKISDGAKIHESVFQRKNLLTLKYAPKNIPAKYEVEG